MNKLLLEGDKFRPEMPLRQSRFMYSACVTFTRNKETIQNLKKHYIQDIIVKTN